MRKIITLVAVIALTSGCSVDMPKAPENAAPYGPDISVPPPTLVDMADGQSTEKVCANMGLAREQGNAEMAKKLGFIVSLRRDISLRDCIRFASLGQKEEQASEKAAHRQIS